MPDVVSDANHALHGPLDWVGMDGIALPLGVDSEEGARLHLPATVSAWVNLSAPLSRGIHMSRLYRALDAGLAGRTPDWPTLHALLQQFLDSHAGLSDRARLKLSFELPVRRPALLSGLHGWRAYPVRLAAELAGGQLRCEIAASITYSSTCPGSAALSRQLIQQQFQRDFDPASLQHADVLEWLGTPRGICATPHAQRSIAEVKVRLDAGASLSALSLIDRVEDALATPVQGAVKREDEQEFARLNAENPMYCEDAVRRIRTTLEKEPQIGDWSIRVAHIESLHAHDAVAMAVRGVAGGFVAEPD